MIKNAIIYRLGSAWAADHEVVENALAKAKYLPASPSQDKSTGFVPPRGEEHGLLVESVGGQWIVKFMVETKTVPTSLLDSKLKARKAQIEQQTGRKPGRKESKELKEEIRQELLPHAFPKTSATLAWINPTAGLLVVDASSNSRADEVISGLIQAIEGLTVALVDTKVSPVAAMAEWLTTQEPPAGFCIEQECELKACDESKAVVRYARHTLDLDEIKQHIAQGKLPTKLAMTWDERISFVLTEGGQLKKLQFLDVVFEGKSADDGGFDADVAITTGELIKMLPDLLQALGGEATPSADQPTAKADDDLYADAVKLVRESGTASISYVQRRLMIGYNRAARLIEAMEFEGVVSHPNTSGTRRVIGHSAKTTP